MLRLFDGPLMNKMAWNSLHAIYCFKSLLIVQSKGNIDNVLQKKWINECLMVDICKSDTDLILIYINFSFDLLA